MWHILPLFINISIHRLAHSVETKLSLSTLYRSTTFLYFKKFEHLCSSLDDLQFSGKIGTIQKLNRKSFCLEFQ